MTVDSALRWAQSHLKRSETASLDAQLLLAHVLDKPRAWVLAHSSDALPLKARIRFTSLVGRRARGEPVAYLRGHLEWYDLDLIVTRDVLVPRQETEVLLETAVEMARSLDVQTVADVGTGCGTIAIGLARALPGVRVIATDVSKAALVVARKNIQRYGLKDRITTQEGSLLEPLVDPPDLLTANLPYLSEEEMENLHRDVSHEPRLALAGGSRGLGLYAELIEQMRARDWVVPAVLEIAPAQVEAITSMIRRALPGVEVRVIQGYAGRDRLVTICPPRHLPG